jgi:Ni/Co efflux regulator RcnB
MRLPPVVRDTAEPVFNSYLSPSRVKKWENPELGIDKVGVVYHPENKTGHIIINDTHHVPVTREELISLGKKRYKNLKLSREEDLPVLIKQGDYAIAGDLLQDLGHTELGSRLSQSQEAIPVKSLPRFHRLPMYERRKDLELPEHGIHKVEVGPHGTRINGHTLLVAPETEGQKLAREYGETRVEGKELWLPRLKKWISHLREQGHPLGKLVFEGPPGKVQRDLQEFSQNIRMQGVWPAGARIPQTWRADGIKALRRVKRLEAPELGIHRVGIGDGALIIVGHQGLRDEAPAVTRLPLRPGLKLSRPLTDLLSKTQQAKRLLATRIAKEAGLKLEELLDARGLDRSDVVQIYSHNNDHDGVNYAAAWYGMVSKAPRVRAFHTDPKGPDTLHRWKTTMKPEDVLAAAPEGTLVTSDGRVTYLDPGSRMDLTDLKRQTAATEDTAERGHTDTMNGRDSYRERIKSYESQ